MFRGPVRLLVTAFVIAGVEANVTPGGIVVREKILKKPCNGADPNCTDTSAVARDIDGVLRLVNLEHSAAPAKSNPNAARKKVIIRDSEALKTAEDQIVNVLPLSELGQAFLINETPTKTEGKPASTDAEFKTHEAAEIRPPRGGQITYMESEASDLPDLNIAGSEAEIVSELQRIELARVVGKKIIEADDRESVDMVVFDQLSDIHDYDAAFPESEGTPNSSTSLETPAVEETNIAASADPIAIENQNPANGLREAADEDVDDMIELKTEPGHPSVAELIHLPGIIAEPLSEESPRFASYVVPVMTHEDEDAFRKTEDKPAILPETKEYIDDAYPPPFKTAEMIKLARNRDYDYLRNVLQSLPRNLSYVAQLPRFYSPHLLVRFAH